MNKSKGLAVVVAALVAGIWAMGGCSESSARKASKKLREEVAKARQVSQEVQELVSSPGQAAAATAAESLDATILNALGDWIATRPGRERILVSQSMFQETLAGWKQCRETMSRIIIEGDKQAKAKLVDLRAGDLLPEPPEDPNEVTPIHKLDEERKARIIQRLEGLAGPDQAEARQKFFAPVLKEVAKKAIEAWVSREPTRMQIMDVADEAAEKMFADWIADEQTRRDMLSAVAGGLETEGSTQLRMLIEAQLQDRDGAKAILAYLREGEPVTISPRPEIDRKALEKLEEARRALAAAIQAAGRADAQTKASAQMVLTRITEQQGECYSLLCRTAADKAGEAVDLAMGAVHDMDSQVKRMGFYAEKAPAAEEKQEEDAVDALKAEISRLESKAEELQDTRKKLSDDADSVEMESRTAKIPEEQEKKLAEAGNLRAQVEATARKSELLKDELGRKRLALSVAEAAWEKKQKEDAVGALKAEISQLESKAKELQDTYKKLSEDADKAEMEGRAAKTPEEQEKKLAEARNLRAQAGEVDAKAELLKDELGQKQLSLSMTAADLKNAEADHTRLKGTMKAREEASAAKEQLRDRLAMELARSRRRLEKATVLAATAFAEAKRAGETADKLFDKAGDDYKNLGPTGAADRAAMVMRQGDLIGGQLQLQVRAVLLNDSLETVLGNPAADPKGATKAFFKDRMSQYLEKKVGELRSSAEAKYANAAVICRDAMRSVGGDRQAADKLREMLAGAYLGCLRVTTDRERVIDSARKSPLGGLLWASPPAADPLRPMAALLQLRRELALEPVAVKEGPKAPAVPATPPAKAPVTSRPTGEAVEAASRPAMPEGVEGVQEPAEETPQTPKAPVEEKTAPPSDEQEDTPKAPAEEGAKQPEKATEEPPQENPPAPAEGPVE
ncbi:MAG TPA: hypothetical protein VM098_02720 [Phycisphaerae bacterium]|nr:hypothetical protein [Phycisphaerae bacterium]